LLKETTGTFDGVRIHGRPIISQMLYQLCHAAPLLITVAFSTPNFL